MYAPYIFLDIWRCLRLYYLCIIWKLPIAGRKHLFRKIDMETGDLILEEPHQQEYWVIKRNMMGHIIDLYRVETDDEIR